MINDLRLVKEYEMIMEKKIIIYGCGSSGMQLVDFIRMLGCQILCFCDSDIKKKGNTVYGIEVCHKTDLSQLVDSDTIIIIASVYYEEIINEIINYVSEEIVFTKFAFYLSVHLHYKQMNFKLPEVVSEYMENWYKTELDRMENDLKRLSMRDYLDVANNAILVYQSGKVGSTSICKTLSHYGVKSAHIHTLTEYSSNDKYLSWCHHVCSNFQGKMIIPVREPISRDISDYFQFIGHRLAVMIETYQFHDLQEGFYKAFYDYLVKDTEYTVKYSYPRINYSKYGYQFDFFDMELKKYFGIDVMEYPFDTRGGYSIVKQNGVEIFLVQLEKMYELEREMGEFLGISNFKIQSTNIGDEKEYKYLYQNFKKTIPLKKEYIDFYYKNNPAVEHFYSEAQREEFRNKWYNSNVE